MDTDQLKAEQRRNWGTVAAGWDKWWGTFERAAQPVSDRLVALADLQPGQNVLDIATGIGEPAVSAARAVGSRGRVVAIDLAPEMLAMARARASSLGLGNLEFHQTDAESLGFAARTFDAALCRWGLMFLPNLNGTLQSARGLLRAGGRFATAAWGPAAKAPMISLSTTVLTERLPIEQPASPLGPFRFAEPGTLAGALEAAGFTDVVCERFPIVFEFASPEAYTRFRRDITTMSAALSAQYPAERIAEAWQAVTEAARRYAGTDGRVRMDNEIVCAAGRR
jgi:SAM-dependent methyltransferase